MQKNLSSDGLRELRLSCQRLSPAARESSDDIAKIVKDVGGIQAQDSFAASLSVWVRGRDLELHDLDQAIEDDRSVVRTWCMRGTLHLVPTDDLGWMLPLLGPRFVGRGQSRYAELGLTPDVWGRAIPAIQDLLSERSPLNRGEIAEHLSNLGIPTEGQIVHHMLRRTALEGLVCHGPATDGKPTYVLLHRWVELGADPGHEVALAELTRRYLAAFEPAGPEDYASWSGLPLSEARSGFEMLDGELLSLDVKGDEMWMLASHRNRLDNSDQARPLVRLLPAFDTFLLGYRDRAMSVPNQHMKTVHPGGGIIRPSLLANREIAGTWTRKKTRDGLEITLKLFQQLSGQLADLVSNEAEDLGRYLGVDVSLEVLS